MASFQFDSGRSQPFRDLFRECVTEQGPVSGPANGSRLDRREWPNIEIAIPEDYPAYPAEAVEVRNTFIHVASPNAEDADRPPLSCPASKIGWIEDLLEDRPPPPPAHPPPPAPPAAQAPEVPKQKEDFSLQGPRPVIRLENALEVQAQAHGPPLPKGRSPGRAFGVIGEPRPESLGQNAYMLPTYGGALYERPQAIQAAPMGPRGNPPAPIGRGNPLANPQGEQLPSAGSAGHAFGTCRPCAFFYAKGCLNGLGCSFCHLCDRGEKKRRQKQKKAMFKGGA